MPANRPLAVTGDEHDLVVAASNPIPSCATSLKTIRSARFARELLACAGEALLAGVRGEADEHLAVLAALAEPAEDVLRGLELHRPVAPSLGRLPGSGAAGR